MSSSVEKTHSLLEFETIERYMITGSKIRLRDKRLADALDDYIWQSDPELARLDAAPLLNSSFPRYLLDYADELRDSLSVRRLFAVETLKGEHIGNCSYYNIDETKAEAELGIMIGNRDYWDKGYGADTVTTLVKYVFHQTNLKRIYLKALDSNSRAQQCFKKCGFTPYGHLVSDGFSFALMELHHEQWQERETPEAPFPGEE